MSPVAAARLTCTTSVEVKIAYSASELWTAWRAMGVTTHLMRENEGKLDFVSYLSISTAT